MTNAIIDKSECDINTRQLSKENSLNYVKVLFICIASIHLLNVLLFFINTWLHINNCYSFFSVTEITSLLFILGIILYVISVRKKSQDFQFLFDLWIFGILISRSISMMALNLYRNDINITNELSIWFFVIGVAICLFITGSYLSNKLIKKISVLFVGIQFLLNLLPNLSLPINSGQVLSISLSPLCFHILACMIFIFLYRYINSLENKYPVTD